MKMKFWKSQLLKPPRKQNKPPCVTCNQTLAMKNWVKNISRKSIERKPTSPSMMHVNQPVVNAPKKISLNLRITIKILLLRKKN